MRVNKTVVFKVLLGAVAVLLLSGVALPTIYGNGGATAYEPLPPLPSPKTVDETGDSESTALRSVSIEENVISGAGFYLRSCSSIMLFLHHAEVSETGGADFSELNLSLDNAIADLEQARKIYEQLVQQMAETPYEPSMLDELLKFNYELFRKKHRLNIPVFSEVRDFLANGLVVELFSEMLCQMDEMLMSSYVAKAELTASRVPAASNLWELQENACQSMLFGQYAARVFMTVGGK